MENKNKTTQAFLKQDAMLRWKVNTPGLLNEILGNNGVAILRRPLQIFGSILSEVGERAAQLNDPKLNALMCRLAIYEVSDPYNKGYNKQIVNEVFERENDEVPALAEVLAERDRLKKDLAVAEARIKELEEASKIILEGSGKSPEIILPESYENTEGSY